MKQLRIFIVAFALLMLLTVMPAPTHAAGLTASQISSILNLLASFGADQNIINNVYANLTNQPTSNPYPTLTTPVYTGGNSNTTGGETPACSVFWARDLMQGVSGSDVLALQQILNRSTDTMVASYGAGSPGNETGVFGPATRMAVMRFQERNGITPAAGYFGVTSRARLSAVCNGQTLPINTIVPPTQTTTSGSQPIVDIKANGADGPLTVVANTSMSIQWSSSNAANCVVYADGLIGWGGNWGTTGVRDSGPVTRDMVFTVQCNGNNQVASDSVRVNVSNQVSNTAPWCALSTNKNSYAYGEAVAISWNSTNATYGTFIAETSGNPNIIVGGDKLDVSGAAVLTANVAGTPSITIAMYGTNGQRAICSKMIAVASPITTTPTTPTTGTPSFIASATSGTAPFTTTFTLTNLPLQGGEVLDFGDASAHISLGTTMPFSIQHIYTVAGTYTAKLLRNGSVFGYTSVTVTAAPVTAPTPSTCSPVPAVDCIQGYVPVSGGFSTNGCALPNKCVSSTAPRISATVTPSAVATTQKLTITWSAQNAPAGSYVYLQLVPVAGGTSGGIIADLKATSGSYLWTIPASNSTSYAGDYRIRGANIISGASYKVRAIVYKPTTNTCFEGCSPTTGTSYVYGDSSNVTITTSAATGGGAAASSPSSFIDTNKVSIASSSLGATISQTVSLMGSGLAAVMDGYLSLFGLALE